MDGCDICYSRWILNDPFKPALMDASLLVKQRRLTSGTLYARAARKAQNQMPMKSFFEPFRVSAL